jgi:hypothetical protein
VRPREASGSGVSNQTVTKLVSILRSATGSGLGVEGAQRLVSILRNATGSGVGSSTADGARRLNIASKTATTSLDGGARTVSVRGVSNEVLASGSTLTVDAS